MMSEAFRADNFLERELTVLDFISKRKEWNTWYYELQKMLFNVSHLCSTLDGKWPKFYSQVSYIRSTIYSSIHFFLDAFFVIPFARYHFFVESNLS